MTRSDEAIWEHASSVQLNVSVLKQFEVMGITIPRTTYSMFNVRFFYSKFVTNRPHTEVLHVMYTLDYTLKFYYGFSVWAISDFIKIPDHSFSKFYVESYIVENLVEEVDFLF